MENKKEATTLRVSGKTPVPSLASSIVKTIEEGKTYIVVRAIGASAVSQMYKGIAVARGTIA
jgi:stage V sporulation protein SpoVS